MGVSQEGGQGAYLCGFFSDFKLLGSYGRPDFHGHDGVGGLGLPCKGIHNSLVGKKEERN